MNLHVNSEDIEYANRAASLPEIPEFTTNRKYNAALYCPVGMALHRIGFRNFEVLPQVLVTDKGTQILLPESMMDFLCSFDNGQEVEPTIFEVRIDMPEAWEHYPL